MLTDQSTIDVIERSRKLVTILFSDIVESTRHWERRGDIDARLLIDRHNRLLFPIIKKYRGRIIKTLGDAIMASFSDPQHAIKAAIAMQQMLHRERQKDKYFSVRIRVGIHTGKGIVENNDIFGDIVNVAAKVQAEAEANQIVLTSGTVARLPRETFSFEEAENIKPKGKRKPIKLFKCNWEQHPDLASSMKPNALMPLLKIQKFEISLYLVICLYFLFFIYDKYIRYILTEGHISLASVSDTGNIPSDFYAIGIALLALFIIAFVYLFRIDFISRSLLKILSGLFGYSLLFLAFHAINSYTQPPFRDIWYGSIYKSSQMFVEVVSDDTPLMAAPGTGSKQLALLPAGEIFIYQDSRRSERRRWDKVRLNASQSAWIARAIPPDYGVARQQLTTTHHFNFYWYDLYGFLLSIFGFIWGFSTFKIRIG